MEHTEETVRVSATGNGTKSHDLYDTFLSISGGQGNLTSSDVEVHVSMQMNDGSQFAQGWFRLTDLRAALAQFDTQ